MITCLETAQNYFSRNGYDTECELVGLSKNKLNIVCKAHGHEFVRDAAILRKPQKKLRCPVCRDELVTAALEYYQAGHSRFECAEKFGLTPFQIQNYVARRGVHGGMSKERLGEFAKENQEKATKASAKANHERAVIRNNEKRIAVEFEEIEKDVDEWRKRLSAIREIQSAKRTKQRLDRVSREIVSMRDYEPQIATCKHCGKQWLHWPSREKYAHKKPPVFCSVKCNHKHYKTGTVSDRLRKRGRADEYRDCIPLDEVIERDNGICYLCGCKTSKDDSWLDAYGNYVIGDTYPTRDHVISIAKGGTHTWDNVRLACRKCNSEKNDRQLEEYAPDLG